MATEIRREAVSAGTTLQGVLSWPKGKSTGADSSSIKLPEGCSSPRSKSGAAERTYYPSP